MLCHAVGSRGLPCSSCSGHVLINPSRRLSGASGVVVQIWGEEALQFQEKLLNSSGLGDETYFPDSEPLF